MTPDKWIRDFRHAARALSRSPGFTFTVVVINSWNRLAISLRAVVGSYQPAASAAV